MLVFHYKYAPNRSLFEGLLLSPLVVKKERWYVNCRWNFRLVYIASLRIITIISDYTGIRLQTCMQMSVTQNAFRYSTDQYTYQNSSDPSNIQRTAVTSAYHNSLNLSTSQPRRPFSLNFCHPPTSNHINFHVYITDCWQFPSIVWIFYHKPM